MAGSTTVTAMAASSRRRRPRGPRPRWAPIAAHAAVWGGAAAVLALWWTDTASITATADWLIGAGRITGLLAGYGCAVLLALMARIPALDHALGTDRLARWHAAGGRYTIGLILVHTLTIIWGYALTGGNGVVSQTADLVMHYPDMLKATAAFALFVLTAALSARAARRRMSYETWHYLHFATYAAIFLAFGHQLANGAEFATNPVARALWYVLYGGVAALLLWYRFVTPLRSALRHRLRVTAVRPEAPGVVSVYLDGRRTADLAPRAGQFFRWRFLTRDLWWTALPFSLSAPADGRTLRITVKEVGAHSQAVARLRPGTRVWAEGPYGGMTPARARTGRSLLLAGGVGITPLRTLFEELPGDTILIYWARTPRDLALRAELDAVAAGRGARVHYAAGEPGAHAVALTGRSLGRIVPDVAARDVYLCGPPGMMQAAHKALRAAGVPRSRVHDETFAF